MERKKLLSLLNIYNPSSEEIEYKERLIDFINLYPDCFKRELQVGHITGSVWLINKEGNKALLMHHSKLNIWVQPGGHADGESDLLKVSLKEAQEESGIIGIYPISEKIFDIDIHLIPGNEKEKEHYHYDIRFLLQVKSDEELKPNKESKELRWIGKNIDELPKVDRSVSRLWEKWLVLN